MKRLITLLLVGTICLSACNKKLTHENVSLDEYLNYYGNTLGYERVSSAGGFAIDNYDSKQYWSNGESAIVVDACSCFEHNSILREYATNGYDKYYQWFDQLSSAHPEADIKQSGDGDTYECFSITSDLCAIAGYRFEDAFILFIADSKVPDDEGNCVRPPLEENTVEELRNEMRALNLEVII